MATFPASHNEGSAFPWVLEHLLAYPGTYEIPLRTMYTLNSTQQAQHYPRQSHRADIPSLSNSVGSSPDNSPASPEFPPEMQHRLLPHLATDHFKSCLMNHISQLPSQPFSLPPAFITSFVRRCFTADLCLVDFTQALTALDYLKDLENRRKREVTLALQRLGLDKDSIGQSDEELKKNHPRIAEWAQGMQEKGKKVESLYTHVYLGLRRWTLINEIRLEPFSKANSIAMLNTLYPPTNSVPPTRQLTSAILETQRSTFFRYITAVEKNGKQVLKNLELQGKGPNDDNGWPAVRESVDKYLRTANGVIEECLEITGPDTLDPNSQEYRRSERRADSGVSFGLGDRPSTSSSRGSRSNSTNNKPLPASPPTGHPPQPINTPLSPKKKGTTLEKIARELRNLRARSDPNKSALVAMEGEKPKTVKKIKSTSSLRDASRAKHTRMGSGDCGSRARTFDIIDDEKRQQLILEARRQKENRVLAPPITGRSAHDLS
ncbi:MAG: hypothetical protein LQ343_007429 [Gyalolechia ehrenbergii]|nr:MAG: hypothetical protein LQ343_007429 [Gyalolechia ehrenbergii]